MNFIIKHALGGTVLIVLSGCASAPYTYNTSQGCGITQWNEKWVESNVESMSWTGACSDGLASGRGSHVVKLKNGKQIQYFGNMYNGDIYGDGTHVTSSGWKSEGNFQNAKLTEGKIFDETGKIMFEGKMANGIEYRGNTITYADSRYGTGKVYVSDGSYYDGEFDGSVGVYVGGNAEQASVYAKRIKDGKVAAWVVAGKEYRSEAAYDIAKTQFEGRHKREIAAKQAAQARKDEQKARETSAALGALVDVIGQVAQNRADQRQAMAPAPQPAQNNSPVASSASGSGGLSSQQATSCSEEIKRKQIESQSWGGNVDDVAARLGRFQKGLFEGRCKGHPEAQAYIAGANKMLGYGGNATGSGGGSPPPLASGSASGPGSIDRSRSSSGSASSEVRDFPEPDRNECIQVVTNTRGGQCNQATSFLVEVKNICPAKIKMNLCLWDTNRNRWQCGSSTGRAGEKHFDKVLQYACKSDGRYIYAGCSEQAQEGRFRNGNCGGDPNTAGKHSLISN